MQKTGTKGVQGLDQLFREGNPLKIVLEINKENTWTLLKNMWNMSVIAILTEIVRMEQFLKVLKKD